MTTERAVTESPQLPFDNPSVVGIAPAMLSLQEQSSISRVRTPSGDNGWLVTRYDEVRRLLADRRLGLSNPNPAKPSPSAARAYMVALMAGDDHDTESSRHAHMRELLVPLFSTRRMRSMQGRIERHVDELLDRMTEARNPIDLHQALSFPLPTMAISDLLGVPQNDRERFGTWARGTFDQSSDRHASETFNLVVDYMMELVARKRVEPGPDILSDLIKAKDGALTDKQVADLGNAVLLFGYETTIVRIDLGVVVMLRNPVQRDQLIANPKLASAAVEEILRLGVGGKGTNALVPRYAHQDITVGSTTIRAGDPVMLAIGAANYDTRVYPHGAELDLEQTKPKTHLAFGHGVRHCIGRTLARIELTAVFERLFVKFPELRLAVPESSLVWQEHRITGGFDELPVVI